MSENLRMRTTKMKTKHPVKKGDFICYRPNIVKVLKVEEDGLWIRGPYGEEQKIDWEDYYQYNK